MIGLVVASGCASTLPASEWVSEQPRGACVVAIERTDGTGSWTLEHHHDAEGRVLSGTARLRYHGRAWERFGYDERGRLAEIFSYEEIEAEDFPCAAEGGCYTPRRRWVAHTRVEHDDAGRLRRWASHERTFGLERDGRYVERTNEGRELSYRYDGAGRVVEIRSGLGTRRLSYQGDRLVRIDADHEYPWFDVVEHDGRGRIVAVRHSNCTPQRECHVTYEVRYAYDDEGRLVREHRTNADSSPRESEVVWGYDGDRVVRRTSTDHYAGAVDARVREHEYDARGRLVAVIDDGQLRERWRFEGACDAVTTGPAAPSPLAALGALPCARSPAYVLDECSRP